MKYINKSKEDYIKKIDQEIESLLEYESKLLKFLSANNKDKEVKLIVSSIISMSSLILKLKTIKERIGKK